MPLKQSKCAIRIRRVPIESSIEFDDVFAAMSRVADHSSRGGINHKIHRMKRNPTNQGRTFIRQFGDIAGTITPVHRQSSGAEDANFECSAATVTRTFPMSVLLEDLVCEAPFYPAYFMSDAAFQEESPRAKS